MIFKKSVVLSSVDNSLKKAVVNLDEKAGKVRGEIKLYNFIEEPMEILTLGVLIDGKVKKFELKRVGYMVYTFDALMNLPENCTCALMQQKGEKLEPIMLGAISGNSSSLEERLISGLRALEQTSAKKVEKILKNSSISFDNDEEIEEEIDEFLDKISCENCAYKSVFYENFDKESSANLNFKNLKSQQNCNAFDAFTKETSIDKIKNVDTKNNQNKNINENEVIDKLKQTSESSVYFFDEISSQINSLFENHPTDEILSDIIPNSKWVKVDYDEKSKFYVVGLIYSNDEVKYVCYGFPSSWSEFPPHDFNEKAQWLPIDIEKPHGQGYWLTYQDAQDGEMVRVDII